MAGLLLKITTDQKPKVSKYTDKLLDMAIDQHGYNSSAYKGIYNQYFKINSTGSFRQTHFDKLPLTSFVIYWK